METVTAFIAILIVGLGTYASRALFIVALADREIPPRILNALDHVAPAVLSALVIALMVDDDGSVALGIPEAMAFLVGASVAWKTRSLILTVLTGMGAFWLFGIWF